MSTISMMKMLIYNKEVHVAIETQRIFNSILNQKMKKFCLDTNLKPVSILDIKVSKQLEILLQGPFISWLAAHCVLLGNKKVGFDGKRAYFQNDTTVNTGNYIYQCSSSLSKINKVFPYYKQKSLEFLKLNNLKLLQKIFLFQYGNISSKL